jgi:hypothetical protein
MKMEKYHNDLLKKVSNIYNINYDELLVKIPYKHKRELPEYDIFLEEYRLKTLKELQEIAIENNCSKSGKKETIIKRVYDILLSKIKEDNNNNINNINNVEVELIEKKDICIGTDNINQDLKISNSNNLDENIENTQDNNVKNSKCIDISDKDLILLLQTHSLSVSGSRNELIDRLKEFYKNNISKNKNIDDYILELDDDEYVSRHELNENLMNIIQKGIKISLSNNLWKYIDYNNENNIINNYYILIPNKNWIFKETDISYEFVGIAHTDSTYIKCDIPEELLLLSS